MQFDNETSEQDSWKWEGQVSVHKKLLLSASSSGNAGRKARNKQAPPAVYLAPGEKPQKYGEEPSRRQIKRAKAKVVNAPIAKVNSKPGKGKKRAREDFPGGGSDGAAEESSGLAAARA